METEMEEDIAKTFKHKVTALIDNEEDISRLFEILKDYHSNLCVDDLVSDLKQLVIHPSRLSLFDEVRPLVPIKQQFDYDSRAPRPPSRSLKVVCLKKSRHDSYGFSVRGGYEYGIGVYVAMVTPDSQACVAGLRVGDQIFAVNGYSLEESTHEEAINLMASKSELVLKVRSLSMVPTKEIRGHRLIWKFVDGPRPAYAMARLVINVMSQCTLGLALDTEGCVQQVAADSLGEEAGLLPGDVIVRCNGQSVADLTQEDVTQLLANTRRLDLYVKRTEKHEQK